MRKAIASLLGALPALLLCLLAGCSTLPMAAVAVDVFNAAETAKTGYDMAVGMGGRKIIEVEDTADDKAEQHLRELLEAQRGPLAQATPYVIEGHAYIIGEYEGAADLDRAKRLAAKVPGVRRTTLCLFPHQSGNHSSAQAGRHSQHEPERLSANSDGEMRDIILRLSGVRTREVRVRVVQGNAVLLGSVKNATEREKLLTSAKSAGAVSVRNYLRLLAVN